MREAWRRDEGGREREELKGGGSGKMILMKDVMLGFFLSAFVIVIHLRVTEDIRSGLEDR